MVFFYSVFINYVSRVVSTFNDISIYFLILSHITRILNYFMLGNILSRFFYFLRKLTLPKHL